VENLGTLSLAESGQISLTMERLEVAEFLAEVAAAFKSQAEAAGIELAVEVADEHGAWRCRPARGGCSRCWATW
jgi:signal transduction histidine kinase